MKSIPESKIPTRLQDLGLENLNVLIFGFKGHGKSSFINSIGSTYRGEYCQLAITGDSTKSLTPNFSVYEMSEKVNSYMKFHDIFGI